MYAKSERKKKKNKKRKIQHLKKVSTYNNCVVRVTYKMNFKSIEKSQTRRYIKLQLMKTGP